MESSYFLVTLFAIFSVIAGQTPTAISPTVGSVVSQPTYQQPDYAPYQTYGYDDTYGGARPASERTEDYPGNVSKVGIVLIGDTSYCLFNFYKTIFYRRARILSSSSV